MSEISRNESQFIMDPSNKKLKAATPPSASCVCLCVCVCADIRLMAPGKWLIDARAELERVVAELEVLREENTMLRAENLELRHLKYQIEKLLSSVRTTARTAVQRESDRAKLLSSLLDAEMSKKSTSRRPHI